MSVPGLAHESVLDLVRAKYVPLLFPLPTPIHEEVSHLMCQAVRSAQMERPDTFEKVTLSLNAIWDGVAEELDRWLQVNPCGMTEQSAAHLSRLPGFTESTLAQRLVHLYAPPEPITRWTGLDDSFDEWVNAYANYIERLFYWWAFPSVDEDPGAALLNYG